MQIFRIIINSVSIVAILLIVALFPLYEKKLKKSLGACKSEFVRKKSKLFVPVIVFAVLLVAIQFFREFQIYITIVLDCVGILASFIATKDFVLQKNAGLYDENLVVDGKIIKKSDIVALPTLEYESTDEFKNEKEKDEFASDAYETAMKSLKIVTESSGTVFVGFENAEERAKAVEIIRNWV